MKCFLKNRLSVLRAMAVLAGTAALLGIPRTMHGVEIPGTEIIVARSVIIDPTWGGVIGSYTYDAANDEYYVCIYGSSQGLRKIWRDEPGDPWQSDTYVGETFASYPSDMMRFARATDIAGGATNADDSAFSMMAGILLNPAAVSRTLKAPANYPETGGDYGPVDADGNITITYGPGELAYIVDGGYHRPAGGLEWLDSKKVFTWDLREIGAPTTAQPDYNTGTSGDPANPNPSGLFGDYNQTDWNDALQLVIDEGKLRGAYTAFRDANPDYGMPELPASSVDNFGRQFAWSSDGQSLYCIDKGYDIGGIYKIDASTGDTEMIHAEMSSSLYAEPTVVAASTCDFGAGYGAGDQIVFNGTAYTNNAGGLSYVVDTAAPVVGLDGHQAKTLLYGDRMQTQLGATAVGNLNYTTSDSEGNIYFWSSSTAALFRRDTEGRVSKVASKAEALEIAYEHDGKRSNGGGFLRLQTREDETEGTTHVTFRGDNSFIGAIQIFEPADLNRDGAADQTDRNLFVAQRAVTQTGTLPAANDAVGADNSAYVNYLAADLSGDLEVNTSGVITRGSVDHMDELLFFQHVNQRPGDLDLDGLITTAELNTIQGNMDAAIENASWFQGDFNRDGRVTLADVDLMQADVGGSYDISAVEPNAGYTGAATGAWADVKKPSGLAADSDSLVTLARDGGATIAGPAGHTLAGYLTVGSVNETFTGATAFQLAASSQLDVALGAVVTGKGLLDGSAGGAMLRLGLPGYGATLVVEDGGQLLGGFTLQGSLRFDTSTDRSVALRIEDLPQQGHTLLGDTPSRLVKTGVGALTLTGVNAYTGETRIEAGTLKAGAAGAIPAPTSLYVGADATLDLNGYDVTVAGLSSSSAGTNPRIVLGANAFTYDSSENGFFRGDISGAGNLIKRGEYQNDESEGKLTLYENTTFTGNTFIEGGTLALQHTSSNNLAGSAFVRVGAGATLDVTKLAGGRFDVAAGQTLGGSGTVAGAVNVGGGAALAPAAGLGPFTVTGALTLNAGSEWVCDFLGTEEADSLVFVTGPRLYLPEMGKVQLTVLGTEGLALGTETDFVLFDGDVYEYGGASPLAAGTNLNDYFDIVDSTGWTGTWELTAGSLILTAVAVPEPSTVLMLLAGMAAITARLGRRRTFR